MRPAAEEWVEADEDSLDLLSRYSVAFRYPAESAIKEEAREAVNAMKHVRRLLRRHFGLE